MSERTNQGRQQLLARLKRIQEHRQQARERELAQQRAQLSQAERQLAEQQAREQAAARHIEQVTRKVDEVLQQSSFTGADALRLQGYLAMQRNVYEAEVFALQTAQSIVQVAQDDAQQALNALRAAHTALQKAEQMHERVAREAQRRADARDEVEIDGDNMAAHVRRKEQP